MPGTGSALLSSWPVLHKACTMKSLRLLLPISLLAALVACGGGKGSSAPAPNNFKIYAEDAQLHMTWDALPGVEYWVFCAPGATSIDSHSSSSTHSGWIYYTKIFSGDFYATGLVNGKSYACTVNGRYNNGPGGADAVPATNFTTVNTPRPAGVVWANGASTALSGMTVKSVAYGPLSALSTSADQFVAVGASGQLAVSTAVAADATLAWGTPAQAVSSVATDLNAVTFYPYTGGYRFVAVGAAGKVVYATNTSPWTWAAATMPAPSWGSAQDMNAVAPVAGANVVAAGNAGYIAYSTDGVSWTATAARPTTNNLRALAFAPLVNGTTSAYLLAVGDAGTILKSTDGGATWTDKSPTGLTAQNLRGVAALPVTNSSTNITTYVLSAVGDAGVWVSTDNGDSWQLKYSTANLVSVSAGMGQIMALDASGGAYTSGDGNTWTPYASGVTAPAAAVLRYNPSFTAVSNGWMVFGSSGNQRIAR